MAERPYISIVIPTRNRARLLMDALASFARLDYPPDRYEIVVVDDGSTDHTSSEVARFAASGIQPAVRPVRGSGSGVNSARNLGVRHASGSILCFVDDDTEATDGWLDAVAQAADTYPDVDVFAGRLTLRIEGPAPRMCGREPLGETELDLGDDDRETRAAWGANLIVRRGILDRVGQFNESLPIYGDETEWLHRYKGSGGRIMYVAKANLVHRRTADLLRTSSIVRRSFRFGRGWARASGVMGRPGSVAGAIASSAHGFAHGLRYRCIVG